MWRWKSIHVLELRPLHSVCLFNAYATQSFTNKLYGVHYKSKICSLPHVKAFLPETGNFSTHYVYVLSLPVQIQTSLSCKLQYEGNLKQLCFYHDLQY
jgi:hypothetical protein